MKSTEKILVTGSSGFLGRHLIPILKLRGKYEVIETTRNENKMAANRVYLDLEKPETILNLEKYQDFDVLVHLGAKVGWDLAPSDSLLMSNVISTGLLSESARKRGAYVVYASAMIVHGINCSKVDETTPVNPDSGYAKSKYIGELLLSEAKIEHCNIRFAGIFGRDGPYHLGINRAIDSAIRGQSPVQVGTGKALRNYIYVKDAARAIIHCIDGRLHGTHLYAGTEIISVQDMLLQICEVCGCNLQPIIKQGRDAIDQVVVPSGKLPTSSTFRESLVDILS